MIKRQYARQAPATTDELPEDWKLEANCATYEGPITDLPVKLCVSCPVREACGDLYEDMQDALIATGTMHTTCQQIGLVWGGVNRAKVEKPVGVEYGSLRIEPCGDDCGEPTFAREACREHYNKQYWAARQEGYYRTGPSARTCTVGDCEEKHAARDMCSHHYHIWRKAQKALGNKPERPLLTSTRPIDEPTYAGYSRAKRAGRDPTEAQLAARAVYGHDRWLRKQKAKAAA